MGRSVYNANGILQKQKTRVIDSLNRLQQDIGGTTYATAPTSAITQYGYDNNGNQANRITAITVPGTNAGVPTITIPGIANAMSVNQSYGYDQLDRLTQFTPGYPGATTAATGQAILPAEAFTYDAIGNRLSRAFTAPSASTASTASYAYPNLATTTGTKRHTLTNISGAQTNAYTYDATGNTLTESAAQSTRNPTTNAINASIALTHTYDAKNRLSKTQIGSTTANTVTYKINALGQRVQKVGTGTYAYSTTTTINGTTGLSPQANTIQFNARYVYDEQGRLLGEYSPEGKLIAETIWFDDLPVATIRPKGSSAQLPLGTAGTGTTTANNTGTNTSTNPVNVDTFYLHPDHLGTPRVATRSVAVAGATTGPGAVNKAVWRHESDPFGTSLGTSAPNENPQNITGTQTQIKAGSMRLDNGFPGQIRDRESGKSYNYFRDYDSSIGRYTESDPIGLRGGPNTFGYVGQSPASRRDEFGLAEMCYYRGWYNGKSDWPHQFICVGGGCRGFYPYSSDPDKDLTTMILSPGEISEDDAQYKSKSSCFQLPSCNEKAMNKCVQKCKKAWFYSLAGSSCINWANNCYESCLIKGCASK